MSWIPLSCFISVRTSEGLATRSCCWLKTYRLLSLQDLPRLQDLEVIFGHELSDEGIFHLAFMKSIRRLKLVNFVRLHDSNIDLLAELPNLEELTIQAS